MNFMDAFETHSDSLPPLVHFDFDSRRHSDMDKDGLTLEEENLLNTSDIIPTPVSCEINTDDFLATTVSGETIVWEDLFHNDQMGVLAILFNANSSYALQDYQHFLTAYIPDEDITKQLNIAWIELSDYELNSESLKDLYPDTVFPGTFLLDFDLNSNLALSDVNFNNNPLLNHPNLPDTTADTYPLAIYALMNAEGTIIEVSGYDPALSRNLSQSLTDFANFDATSLSVCREDADTTETNSAENSGDMTANPSINSTEEISNDAGANIPDDTSSVDNNSEENGDNSAENGDDIADDNTDTENTTTPITNNWQANVANFAYLGEDADFTINLFDDFLDQGKDVIIELYANWCGHCQNYQTSGEEGHGVLHNLAMNYGDQIAVVMVEGSHSTPPGDNTAAGIDFFDTNAYVVDDMVTLFDNYSDAELEIDAFELMSYYGATGFPTLLYIDAETKIGQPLAKSNSNGYKTAEDLFEEITGEEVDSIM